MDEQSIALLAEKILGDVNFWVASIGLTGVIIGALITGVFSYFQSKQAIENAKMEKKKELLLMKYECMYKDLDNYYEYTQEISLLTINSIDANLDIKKLKTNLKDNNFIMYSMFYIPNLSAQVKEFQEELGNVIKPLTNLIVKTDATRDEKEKLIDKVVISSLGLQHKVKKIQQELAQLTNQLIST